MNDKPSTRNSFAHTVARLPFDSTPAISAAANGASTQNSTLVRNHVSSSMIGPPIHRAWARSPKSTSGKTARKIAALTRLNTNLNGAVRKWTSFASCVVASMSSSQLFSTELKRRPFDGRRRRVPA